MPNLCRSGIMSNHKIQLFQKNEISPCVYDYKSLEDIEYIQYTVFIQCHMKYGPS